MDSKMTPTPAAQADAMLTETPRTDEIAHRFPIMAPIGHNEGIEQYNDLLDLCRSLERELQSLRNRAGEQDANGCVACQGFGSVQVMTFVDATKTITQRCKVCNGSGKHPTAPVAADGGEYVRVKVDKLEYIIKLPSDYPVTAVISMVRDLLRAAQDGGGHG